MNLLLVWFKRSYFHILKNQNGTTLIFFCGSTTLLSAKHFLAKPQKDQYDPQLTTKIDIDQNIHVNFGEISGFQADKEPARVKDSRLLACLLYRLCVQGSTEEARGMHGST